MTDAATIIAGMLTENTGIHMLDSGFEGGRAWQRNQGKNFAKEPASVLEVDFKNGDLIISKSTYHYLTEFLESTPESERLNAEFKKFDAQVTDKNIGWLQMMEKFFDEYLKPEIQEDGWTAYNVGDKGEVTNTYNYESSIDQVLQYMLFPWRENKPFIMLQIHGGADVRGGYTAPKIFEIRGDIDDFFLADPDYDISTGDDSWYTDDNGYHWYFNGTGNKSMDQKQMVDRIRAYMGLTDEDIDVETSRKFAGYLTGVSIDKGNVVGRCHKPAGREASKTNPFDVYLRGKCIDTVFYNASDNVTDKEVKKSLVDHDGYDPNIFVVKARR